MDRGLEVVLDSGGFDDPLILAIAAAFMEELRGGVVVGGVDEIRGVLHVGALNAEALDEHGESRSRGRGKNWEEGKRRKQSKARSRILCCFSFSSVASLFCSAANKGLFISRLVFCFPFLFFRCYLLLLEIEASLHAVHLATKMPDAHGHDAHGHD
jgi:hypothetical protein